MEGFAGHAHEPLFFFYLAINIVLNALNVYWFFLIVKKALRPREVVAASKVQ